MGSNEDYSEMNTEHCYDDRATYFGRAFSGARQYARHSVERALAT